MDRWCTMKQNADELVIMSKERQHKEWYNQYGKKLALIEEQLNEWLLDGSEESKRKAAGFFHEDENSGYLHTEKVAIISLFLAAYELEKEKGINDTILNKNMGVQELVQMYTEMKFLIWNLEFGWDNSEQHLLNYIMKNKVSWYTVQFLVYTTAFSKDIMINKIIILLQEGVTE